MKFVNYNLPHIREKKGRPLDKEPFVEPPLSEESGSVKNDISIHVPVFMEKLDGRYESLIFFQHCFCYKKKIKTNVHISIFYSDNYNIGKHCL